MPADSMSDMDSMYGDKGEPKSPDSPTTTDEERGEPQSALVPKSVLGKGPFKEGDTVTLHIVADHGDEVEVCAAEDESDKPGDMTEPGEGAYRELDSMNQP